MLDQVAPPRAPHFDIPRPCPSRGRRGCRRQRPTGGSSPRLRRPVERVARLRAPVNHPTVVLRRSHVLAVGGYSGFVGIEDYFLWGKLLAAGRSLDNLPDVLVKMRAGAALGRRRGGWRYLRVEAALFRRFVQIGFLTPGQAVVGLAMRLPLRVVPAPLRSWVYRRLLRRPVPGE